MNLASALALAAACAAGPGVARAAADDHELERASISALRRTEHFTIFDSVTAQASDGVVVLTGKVTTAAKKEGIGRQVESVPGVQRVHNDLVVLPPSPADAELRHRIARNIYGHASFWRYAVMAHPPIHIVVESGGVTLTGVVRSEAERALARTLAFQAGPTDVAVQLTIDSAMELRH
jgi:osmotically-inducible protein OsmY